MASYEWLPIGHEVDSAWFLRVSLSTGLLLIVSASLAAPLIVALWLFDVLAAVLSRNLPQMNIFFVALPLKIMTGLALVSLVIQHFAGFFRQLNDVALRAAHSWIG
jgi:flagellar biosynthetic protein FliR